MNNGRITLYHPTHLAVLLVSALVLSGCAPLDWVKQKFGVGAPRAQDQYAMDADLDETMYTQDAEESKDGDEVLASMAGKPIITAKSLTRDFDRLLEDNPQLKSVLPIMPDAKYNFLQGMVHQAVVDKKVTDEKINDSPEFKAEYARMMRSVRSMLNTKYFSLKYPVQLSDAEIQKFYDENKDTMPDLIISRGGVNAAGVSFKSEAAAKDFMTKAKGKDLAKVAETSGKKNEYRDFKLVNTQSLGVDTAIRSKIVNLKKFPALELVKASDNTFWVVAATAAEEPKYRPLEQVQAGLRQYLEKEKRMEEINREIDRLKKEYQVVINEDYFKRGNDKMSDVDQLGGAQREVPMMADAGDNDEFVEQVQPVARAA